jgi:FdhD protein
MSSNRLASTSYVMVENNAFTQISGQVIGENHLCININGKELATLICTPDHFEDLAMGFLRSEEIIKSLDDIAVLSLSTDRNCIDIWLKSNIQKMPARHIYTSGCGGGFTFDDLVKERSPLTISTQIDPTQVGRLMYQLYQYAELYKEVRGVHTSALCNGQNAELVAEDIGRHNTIDRLWGQAMRQNISTEGKILVCTGRISSEMLGKAAKMGVPIVISRTSPTSLSVDLAHAWNMTVIGYARRDSFRIYSAPHRIVGFND